MSCSQPRSSLLDLLREDFNFPKGQIRKVGTVTPDRRDGTLSLGGQEGDLNFIGSVYCSQQSTIQDKRQNRVEGVDIPVGSNFWVGSLQMNMIEFIGQ